MRVVIVGPARERERLRLELFESGVEVVGEAPTILAARRAGMRADAWVVAAHAATPELDTAAQDLAAGQEAIDAPVRGESLTPRELDVARLLSLGLTNRAIADRLGISDQTVKFHVASILGKLGATNRTDAVHRALRRGLIEL